MLPKHLAATHVLCTLVCAFCILPAHAQDPEPNPNPPDQLSPGALLPQLDKFRLPQEQEEMFPIPPMTEREWPADGGPLLVMNEFDLFIDPVLRRASSAELTARVNEHLIDALSSQPAEGFSIRDLESIASEITDIYRNDGFILAWAYIPVQRVRKGIVRMNVLPGTLSAVNVEGNTSYTTERLSQPFEALLNRPVQIKELQSAALRTSDYPGLTPTAVLSPGEEVGTSALTISVTEQPFAFSVSGDNYGTQLNGSYRLIGTMLWNNPVGLGDQLRVDILQTLDPAQNTYGSVFYRSPFGDNSWFTGANIYTNRFEVGSVGQELGLEGDSAVAGLFLEKHFLRSRRSNLFVDGAFNVKRAAFDSPFAASGQREDKLSVFTLGLNYDSVDSIGGLTGINDIRLWVDVGLADFLGSMDADGDCNSTRQGSTESNACTGISNFQYAGGDFSKLGVSFQRMQQVTTYNSLLIRGYYQFSNDLLVSLEQVALGGAYNNRGYPVSQSLVDKGGFVTFEWIYDFAGHMPNVMGNVRMGSYTSWNWFAFLDFGGGEKNEPFPGEEDKVSLASLGGGLEMTWNVQDHSTIGFRFELATPLGDDPLSIDDDDPRIWGRLYYSF